ncbi:MAG: hypothetical protein ACRC0J_15660 [Shewanella oncorhynchi]
MDVISEPGTVYAEIDHSANSHSLFRGVGTGSIGSHKIFAFSVLSEMCDEEIENCSEIDLEEINERSVLIQTGQTRNDSVEAQVASRDISKEYRDLTRRRNVSPASVAGSARTTAGTSSTEGADVLFEIFDELPYTMRDLLILIKNISPAIILLIAGLGVIFEWHTAVCLLVFVVTFNAGKKVVEEFVDRMKRKFQRKRNRRLGDLL